MLFDIVLVVEEGAICLIRLKTVLFDIVLVVEEGVKFVHEGVEKPKGVIFEGVIYGIHYR